MDVFPLRVVKSHVIKLTELSMSSGFLYRNVASFGIQGKELKGLVPAEDLMKKGLKAVKFQENCETTQWSPAVPHSKPSEKF